VENAAVGIDIGAHKGVVRYGVKVITLSCTQQTKTNYNRKHYTSQSLELVEDLFAEQRLKILISTNYA
jgi:hypothetical protein